MFGQKKDREDGSAPKALGGDGSPYDDEAAPAAYNPYGTHNDVSDDSIMDPESGVKRGLKNRHLSMMALAGIIGPGLLVGAGGALSSGGPASLIIGFGVIGTLSTSSHVFIIISLPLRVVRRCFLCRGGNDVAMHLYTTGTDFCATWQASSHFQSCSRSEK